MSKIRNKQKLEAFTPRVNYIFFKEFVVYSSSLPNDGWWSFVSGDGMLKTKSICK